jgi:hypothetical protein
MEVDLLVLALLEIGGLQDQVDGVEEGGLGVE